MKAASKADGRHAGVDLDLLIPLTQRAEGSASIEEERVTPRSG